jgi:type VI protein secretion system component Hcp
MCNNEDNNYLVLSMMKENIKGNKKEYSNIKLQKKKNKDRIYLEAKYGP